MQQHGTATSQPHNTFLSLNKPHDIATQRAKSIRPLVLMQGAHVNFHNTLMLHALKHKRRAPCHLAWLQSIPVQLDARRGRGLQEDRKKGRPGGHCRNCCLVLLQAQSGGRLALCFAQDGTSTGLRQRPALSNQPIRISRAQRAIPRHRHHTAQACVAHLFCCCKWGVCSPLAFNLKCEK